MKLYREEDQTKANWHGSHNWEEAAARGGPDGEALRHQPIGDDDSYLTYFMTSSCSEPAGLDICFSTSFGLA